MMTHEEIQDAIEQLRELGGDGCITNADIIDAVFSGNNFKVRDTLADILRQADPDAHIELPKDADGEYVHIGDEVYAKYANGGYYNGRVNSLEFEENSAYAYVTTKDGDGDQFKASSLHHGGHIRTARQVLTDFAHEIFELGVSTERNNEAHCSATYKERASMIKTYTMELAPLLSDEAETGYEADESDD